MDFSRREFLQSTSGVIGLAALGGCEWLSEQIRNRPVRRDISTLAPTDAVLQTYRDAVAQMRALPMSDPRNWTRQAEIHQNF